MLTARELRLLESLRLSPSHSYRGATKGERISKRKGVSIEFSDYRSYADGDDLRHLDWNVLARLETPVLRTYQDEEDLIAYIVLDTSPSMQFGEPEKLATAKKHASALGLVGLHGGDAIRLINGSVISPPMSSLRGRSGAKPLFSRLESLETGACSVSNSLQSLMTGSVQRGIVFLVSDGLDLALESRIRVLGGRGFEVWMLQLLDDGELEPDLEGDLRLIDSESSAFAEITVNRDTLATYRANLDALIGNLKEATRRTGGKHALVRTSESLETVIARRLKPERWFE